MFRSCAGSSLVLLTATGILQSGGPPPQKVRVSKVERRSFERSITAIGHLEALKTSNVGAVVEGPVESVEADAGSAVKNGQVLLTLRRTAREIRRRKAQAELRFAEQDLQEWETGSREEDKREASAAVAEARARVEEATRDLDRILELEKTSIVSARERTAAAAVVEGLKALYEQRKARHERVLTGARAEEIERARAQVEIKMAELEEIDDELSHTSLHAPFDGIIVEKWVERGTYVSKGDPVFTVIAVDPIRLMIDVPESAILRVRTGMKVRAVIAGREDFPVLGTVESIVPRGDPLAHSFPVRVLIDNPDHDLLPGMSAQADLTVESTEPLLAVPRDALVPSGGGRIVFTVRDGVVHPVTVKTGLESDGFVEVDGPLADGDLVVVRGNELLRPGQTVIVVESDAEDGRKAAEGRRP